jgi:glycosyltransferase involved in cell wall biosynthesis
MDVYHALATMEGLYLNRRKSISTILDLFSSTMPEFTGAGMGYSRLKLEIGRRYFDFGARLATHCRFVTCISQKTADEVVEYLRVPEDNLRVINLGIDADLNPAPKRDKVFRVGTLNQLDKRKRINLLISAFQNSKVVGELQIAGGGLDREMLEAQAGDDPHIQFLGVIPNSALRSYYTSLSLFCSPTANEGWGLSLVEAMACKTPCLVLADAALPEEIKSRCVVTDDLAAGIRNWKRPPQELIDSNYIWAKGFTWEKCVGEYEKLYREIAQ